MRIDLLGLYCFVWQLNSGGFGPDGHSARNVFRLAASIFAVLLFASASPAAAQVQPAFPIVFVHGINSSGKLWAKMIHDFDLTGALRMRVKVSETNACVWNESFENEQPYDFEWQSTQSAGTLTGKRFFAINFSDPNDRSFVQQGQELKTVIDCVKGVTGFSKVILIAHSMGGLASRTYLQELAAKYEYDVQQLITIGTPHAGAIRASNLCLIPGSRYSLGLVTEHIADLGCSHIAVQELAPSSEALEQLNSLSQKLPPIPYTSIVGQYGVGWPTFIETPGGRVTTNLSTYRFNTDGIVTESSQSLQAAFPLFIPNHQTFPIPISNCDEAIPHLCEAGDSFVINRVKRILGSSAATATVATGTYARLTSSSVYLRGEASNDGYTSYVPSFSWSTSPPVTNLFPLSNIVELPEVSLQGGKEFHHKLEGLTPGQTIYYRLGIQTPTQTQLPNPAPPNPRLGKVESVVIPAVIPTYLSAPSLLAPLANATNQSVRPVLTWNKVQNATNYRVLLARSPEGLPTNDPNALSCANCVGSVIVQGATTQLSGDLLVSGKSYYWAVQARSSDRVGLWSAPQRFDTAPASLLPTPTLSSPISGAVSLGVTPTVAWPNVAGATSYRIMIAQSASQLPSDPAEGLCNACSLNVTVASNSYTIPVGALTSPGAYYVQIKARNALQYGNWTAPLGFSTHNPVMTSSAQYTIGVSFSGTGSVTGGGSYLVGNNITVSATPNGGAAFSAWTESGVVVSNSPAYSFRSERNRSLVALFVSSAQYSLLSLSATPASCGTVSGEGWKAYPPPAPVTYSATANPGCVFLGWYENGNLISLNLSDQLSPTAQNRQVTAVFGIALANQTRPPPKISVGITGGTVVLKQDGSLWNWGSNVMNAGAIPRPTRVTMADAILSKAGVRSNGGGVHFWLGNGDLYGYGINSNGVLSGTTASFPTPTKLLTNVSEAATGDFSALVVRTDGTVWMWGNNINQLNAAFDPGPFPLPPQQVPGLANMVGVGYGLFCNAALKVDGSVWTWGGGGSGVNGCLGDGSTDVRRFPNGSEDFSPKQVPTLSQVVQVSCGFDFCLARRKDGSVFSWGNNTYGQIGDGTTTKRYVPVQLSITDVVSVHAQFSNAAAIRSDGTVYTWGRHENSRLGYPASTFVKTPTQVPGLSDIVEIAHTGSPVLAMQRNGDLWTWGYNLNGGLGAGTTVDEVSPKRVLCPAGMQGYFNMLSDTCSYSVTPSANSGGTISPTSAQSVGEGGSTTFTVVANVGAIFTMGGTCPGNLVGNTFTTNSVTANCTVVANFVQASFTVTPSSGTNGTISPSTVQTANNGAVVTFTVTPISGYVASVAGTCTGTLVGNIYTTNAASANCTVIASFAQAASVTVALSSSSNRIIVGQFVTLTATVFGALGTPSGSITFLDGGVAIFGCASVPLVNGIAHCVTNALVPGEHTISAQYSGSGPYGAATSASATQRVISSALAAILSFLLD